MSEERVADATASAAIILVEDDEMVRELLELSLTEAAFHTICFADACTAISAIDDMAGNVLGLVTDINLGDGQNGWDIARNARELNPDLPVVYITAAAAHDWAWMGVPHSVLLMKPFAPEQLVTAVALLLKQGAKKA